MKYLTSMEVLRPAENVPSIICFKNCQMELKTTILILDEPESSFDNIFLRDGVDSLLKDISKTIPVIIATHNNTNWCFCSPRLHRLCLQRGLK